MTYRYNLAAAVTLAMAAFAAQADFVDVPGPSQWNRGDPHTGYLDFDSFTGATGPSSATASGNMTGTITQSLPISPPGGIFGGPFPADNRLYTHSDPVSWSIAVDPSSFDVNYVDLRVKEAAGSGLATAAVLANGEAPDSVSVFADGDGDSITRFFWALDTTISAGNSYDVTLSTGPFAFDSYDSFALDASAVPLPAAAWLFGSAMLGLIGFARRKPCVSTSVQTLKVSDNIENRAPD
jgi:hypothetical protein